VRLREVAKVAGDRQQAPIRQPTRSNQTALAQLVEFVDDLVGPVSARSCQSWCLVRVDHRSSMAGNNGGVTSAGVTNLLLWLDHG